MLERDTFFGSLFDSSHVSTMSENESPLPLFLAFAFVLLLAAVIAFTQGDTAVFEHVSGTDLVVLVLCFLAGVLVVVTWMIHALRQWFEETIDRRVAARLEDERSSTPEGN